jgi:hypothetical protein
VLEEHERDSDEPQSIERQVPVVRLDHLHRTTVTEGVGTATRLQETEKPSAQLKCCSAGLTKCW